MAQRRSYTDVVHIILRDTDEALDLNDIVDKLVEEEADNPPKSPRSTVRSAIRNSGTIKQVGKNTYGWLPRIMKGAKFRHTLHPRDFQEKKLYWDTDALIALWPAVEEPETRRVKDPVKWSLDSGEQIEVALDEDEEHYFSAPNEELWNWIEGHKARPGDDLIILAENPMNSSFRVTYSPRSDRNEKLIEDRNRLVKRRTEHFLQTQRGNVAEPREIVASLIASETYHDSIPPQTLSNLLPQQVVDRFGMAAPIDEYTVEERVLPPEPPEESAEEEAAVAADAPEEKGEEVPFNTGRELPDEKAYLEALQMLQGHGRLAPETLVTALKRSHLCSPAYAMLSQTSEYRRQSLELAGQAVVAAERRMAHGFIESLVTGEEFPLEESMADYLEARSFLARALWHAGNQEDAIEQAMHCFEVDPEDPAVREDLFVMLFDTDRHEMVVSLLESFPGASVTENLYHQALAALLEDPESREAKKLLRKAVSHNGHLASRFLGEEPKKSKRSSVEEAESYEAGYGFLWRREDAIFDVLEEIVLARR